MRRVLFRTLAAFAAFLVGWVVYMIGMLVDTYDGFISIVLQPFMAVLVSGLFVLAALVSGLVLRLPPLRRWWYGSSIGALGMSVGGALLLCFGYVLGLRFVGVHPETGAQITMLHPTAALVGYFAIVFGIANCPLALPHIRPRRRSHRGLPQPKGAAEPAMPSKGSFVSP